MSSTFSTRFAKHPLWSKPSQNRENHEKRFFISWDLKKIIDLIVPEERQGLPNLISTKQVRGRCHFIHEISQD
jgi:hypothetical protein